MISLKGRNVLLIAPVFFGYQDEIATELRERGATVDFVPDRPFQSPLMKAVTRIKRDWVTLFANHFFWNAIQSFDRRSYDFIFVINGEALTPSLIKSLRSTFPSATIILYMWDSFLNRKFLIPNILHYDECSTFDRSDSNFYGMAFRPLFFSSGFRRASNNELTTDLSFIGTAHSDRYEIISKLKDNLPVNTNSYFYLYLHAPWVFYFYKLVNPAFKKSTKADFMFKPLDKFKVQQVFHESRAILDIEHPSQTGLTMRSLETVGAAKKLITTNRFIEEYDFFRKQNILILDRKNIHNIPKYFFDDSYIDIPDKIYYKYSIQGWIDDLIR